MPRIQVLPPGLVNQIAAGEVVERPASVVKELVENALDAGARAVQVEVEDGGLSLVRVADDGSGMERDDALLALERHATSKLRDASGLAAIATMGFRGEALPAIASVARLRLDTCPGGDGAGTRISVEGGRVLEVAEVARARGTTIEVRDLFSNTPARRKFVRAPATAAGHATEAALRLALARCDVAFLLRSGGRVAWSFAAGSPLGERAAAGLGPLMYKTINRHPGTRKLYADRLAAQGVIAADEGGRLVATFRQALDGGFHTNKTILSNFKPPFAVDWSKYKNTKWDENDDTQSPLAELQHLAERLTAIPPDFKLHPRVEKIIADRRLMGQGKLPVDWGMAENLAYASLFKDGYSVRISGQDCGRGTFFHRHAVLHDQNREKWDSGTYIPLAHIAPNQGDFVVIDSVLS